MKALLLLLTCASSCMGFVVSGNHWPNGLASFQTSVAPYNDVAAIQFAQWGKYTNHVQLFPTESSQASIVRWSADAQMNFPSNILAVTFVYTTGNLITHTDVVVNSIQPWGSYSGPLQHSYDIGRVLLHEFGHCIGIDHSDTINSIMAPYIGNLYQLTSDDIAGARYLYGRGDRLINISTRAKVETGDRVMIAGFIVSGSATIVVRAIGPSLGTFNVSNPLVHPVVELIDSNGNVVQPNATVPDSLAPPSQDEIALAYNLAEGRYTAILSGANQATGVALVEIYEL